MKKTLLSVIAGLAVIGSACAAPTPADRKALCEKHPEKYVWVEKTQACVPINPCKSDNSAIQEAYCNRVFKNVQLGNWTEGVTAVKAYLQKYLAVDMTNSTRALRREVDTSVFGQDYIPAKTSDGGYMVFEFDDLSDIAGSDRYDGAVESSCIIQGGRYSFVTTEGDGLYCLNMDESDCSDISELASSILRDVLFTSEYKEDFLLGGNVYKGCKFIVEK